MAVRCTEAAVTVLLGARQVGKTTLARMFCRGRADVTWYDLETSAGMEGLRALPEKTLGGLRGLVVLDEVQRMPELFRILRPLCDRQGLPARFLLLGSASPDLMHGVSESLAGRVQFLHVPGMTVQEVGAGNQDRLWVQGGFPAAFLAKDAVAAARWHEGFVQTFLERDIPQLGIRVPAAALRRFWAMAAHYHGQILNLFKASDAPKLTRSMRIAVDDLKLDRLWVLHPAESAPCALTDKIEARPLRRWTPALLQAGGDTADAKGTS